MVISLDIETTKKPRHFPWVSGSYLVSASICREDGSVRSWLFNHPEAKQSIRLSLSELAEELNNADRIIAHNAKFELCWLLYLGFNINNYKIYCTQVAEYLLRQQQRGELSLEELSKYYGIPDKIDRVKMFWESGYETDEIPSSILVPYCEQDTINAFSIYRKQVKQINSMGLSRLSTMQFELCKILARIEVNGMKLDNNLAKKYSEEAYAQIKDYTGRLVALIRRSCKGITETTPINLQSKEHLSAILYGGDISYSGTRLRTTYLQNGDIRERLIKSKVQTYTSGLGFKPDKKWALKKEGYFKTDVETLLQLKCKTKDQREFLSILFSLNKLAKQKSTYYDGLLEAQQEDGCVHGSFNQTITNTGRLSSSKPNLQNQPRGSTSPVKELFISRY